MTKTHSTSQPGTLVWVATYASLDDHTDLPVGVFATRAAAVASVHDDIDAWDVADGPVEEDHLQPAGEPERWYSSWRADDGLLCWSVRAAVLG